MSQQQNQDFTHVKTKMELRFAGSRDCISAPSHPAQLGTYLVLHNIKIKMSCQNKHQLPKTQIVKQDPEKEHAECPSGIASVEGGSSSGVIIFQK